MSRLSNLGAMMPRSAIIAGFASPSLQRLIDHQIEREQLELQLLAVAGPARSADLEAEVESRADALTEWWQARPSAPPDPPRIMALRSVIDDVTRGYW